MLESCRVVGDCYLVVVVVVVVVDGGGGALGGLVTGSPTANGDLCCLDPEQGTALGVAAWLSYRTSKHGRHSATTKPTIQFGRDGRRLSFSGGMLLAREAGNDVCAGTTIQNPVRGPSAGFD